MKSIAIPILAVVLSFTLSCQKEQDDIVTKTINVTLAPGESYSSVIHLKSDKDECSITLQAEHASISELSASANKEKIFSYIPASGYTGNDQVQITDNQGNQHGHGSCPMHSQDETTVYVYKITVTGESH
jgi:hypothetical protein